MRNFDAQQEYINQMQKELNQGLKDREFIVALFPLAKCRSEYNQGERRYLVELQAYRRAWGVSSDEHVAWSKARECLNAEGVLSAFPENGQANG